MESVTSSSRAIQTAGDTVINRMFLLIDPALFLLLGFILVAAVCLRGLAGFPDMSSGDHDPALFSQCYYDDARAFLFFQKADVNNVGLEELALIPGIGEKTAEEILDFRHANGFILDIQELQQPQGPVKSWKMPALRAFLYTGRGTSADTVQGL